MGNQVSNQPKHVSLIRTSLKKVKDNPDAKHMFYMINNRSKKNALIHIDPKPGRSASGVKNPASIRKHLQTVIKDKFEDSFRSLLEISTRAANIKDAEIKKLTSCAGEVGMVDDKFNFVVTVKGGKATEGDLRKVLSMSGIKRLIPGSIMINGAPLEDEEEDTSETNVAAQLAVLKERLSGAAMTEEAFDDLIITSS